MGDVRRDGQEAQDGQDRQGGQGGQDAGREHDGLAPGEREAVATELLAESERLRLEIDAAEEAEAQLRADCALDAADAGAENVSREQLRDRSAEAQVRLDRTVAALGRLREGTFGLCTDCSRPLGRERLLAVPTAALCLACRRRREAAAGSHSRGGG
ncbi:TraR/DksA family transcriptional regulator [Streptomyces ovatisporus]|uniref:TraR/DksA family transcriptional regulator n=1 Tax=Streptomyces ovatisporus TaxID=1128682 RepID=A0ABV9A645_9ACTN